MKEKLVFIGLILITGCVKAEQKDLDKEQILSVSQMWHECLRGNTLDVCKKAVGRDIYIVATDWKCDDKDPGCLWQKTYLSSIPERITPVKKDRFANQFDYYKNVIPLKLDKELVGSYEAQYKFEYSDNFNSKKHEIKISEFYNKVRNQWYLVSWALNDFDNDLSFCGETCMEDVEEACLKPDECEIFINGLIPWR